MEFAFTDEQDQFRAVVRRFLSDKSPTTEVRRLMDTPDGFDPDVWRQLAADLVLTGSASNGIVLRDGAGFTAGSARVTISGSAAYPISIFARSVGSVPTGTYTGNAIDEILLPATSGNDTMTETTTVRSLGVPYKVGLATSAGDLRIEAVGGVTTPVTVTVEAGVVMRFHKGGVLRVSTASSTSP
ncbi:MAG TPA: hypothetical protein VL379_03080, partial [Pseudomonadales bacterium]|nr:hypothetical protein [Pseudomonadales bacterium]